MPAKSEPRVYTENREEKTFWDLYNSLCSLVYPYLGCKATYKGEKFTCTRTRAPRFSVSTSFVSVCA